MFRRYLNNAFKNLFIDNLFHQWIVSTFRNVSAVFLAEIYNFYFLSCL